MRRAPLAGPAVLAAALVLGLAPRAPADVRYVGVAAGDAHTCAIKASGDIVCWGDNSAGQANPPVGRFSAVTAGERHSCALRLSPGQPDNDTVACWGDNSAGQTNPPGAQFLSISAGLRHTCGIRRDFTLACWGDNSFGQATAPPGPFRQLSTGGTHACAEQSGVAGNPLVCWGDNSFGQTAPPPPGRFPGGIGAGRNHTCGIKGDGGVVCWGDNSSGQTTPPADGLLGRYLSGGGRHTCAVRAFGGNTVVCWGDNGAGQATPTGSGRFIEIRAGGAHSCGLTSAGALFCWGSNGDGQAPPPGDAPPLVHIQVRGCSPCRAGDTFRVSLDFSNPGPARTVEFLAISHSPDGVSVRPFLDYDLEVILPPGESIIDVPPVTIAAGLPTGTYFIEAAVLHAATGATLSRHSVPVQFLP